MNAYFILLVLLNVDGGGGSAHVDCCCAGIAVHTIDLACGQSTCVQAVAQSIGACTVDGLGIHSQILIVAVVVEGRDVLLNRETGTGNALADQNVLNSILGADISGVYIIGGLLALAVLDSGGTGRSAAQQVDVIAGGSLRAIGGHNDIGSNALLLGIGVNQIAASRNRELGSAVLARVNRIAVLCSAGGR